MPWPPPATPAGRAGTASTWALNHLPGREDPDRVALRLVLDDEMTVAHLDVPPGLVLVLLAGGIDDYHHRKRFPLEPPRNVCLWPRIASAAAPKTLLMNDVVVHKQISARGRRAPDRLEPKRPQSVEEPSPAARYGRGDHKPEFINDAGGEQRLDD